MTEDRRSMLRGPLARRVASPRPALTAVAPGRKPLVSDPSRENTGRRGRILHPPSFPPAFLRRSQPPTWPPALPPMYAAPAERIIVSVVSAQRARFGARLG